jgi:Ankyrin repeat
LDLCCIGFKVAKILSHLLLAILEGYDIRASSHLFFCTTNPSIMVVGAAGDHQCCYREQLAFSIYSKFCEPKLYRLANKGDWDLIPARCKAHPKEAAFKHKYAPNDTALHLILRVVPPPADDVELSLPDAVQEGEETTTRATVGKSLSYRDIATLKLNAIRAILKAHPPAAAIQDAFGRTPLHLACMDVCTKSGIAVLELLIGENGGNKSSACLLLDVEKRTPLHYLVSRSINAIPMPALQVLLQACPEAVLVQDVVKETPMDIVTRRVGDGECIENVDQVLEMLQQYATEVVASGGARAMPIAPSAAAPRSKSV